MTASSLPLRLSLTDLIAMAVFIHSAIWGVIYLGNHAIAYLGCVVSGAIFVTSDASLLYTGLTVENG